MGVKEIIKKLKNQANPKNVKGMIRFGISSKNIYGIPMPILKKTAKKIGKDQQMSQKLWQSGIYEARIIAGLIGEPVKVTEKQMEKWVKEFDSWGICDSTCSNLFDKTPFAYQKAFIWSKRKEEFIKRAGFVMMACLSVHDKNANNQKFEQFFPIIKREADDQRNFVKKAVNWALRQIGKRNLALNKKAIKVAKQIQKKESKSAKWIANDALRELTSEAIQKRLQTKT